MPGWASGWSGPRGLAPFAESSTGQNWGEFLHYLRLTWRQWGELSLEEQVYWRAWWDKKQRDLKEKINNGG